MKINSDESHYSIVKKIEEYVESINVLLRISQKEVHYTNNFILVNNVPSEEYGEIILCLIGRIDIDDNKILINAKITKKELFKMKKFLNNLKNDDIYYLTSESVLSNDYCTISVSILKYDNNTAMSIIQKFYDLIV